MFTKCSTTYFRNKTKVKMLSSFTPTQALLNLYEFHSSWVSFLIICLQNKTFWIMLVTKHLMAPIDFHSIFLPLSIWLPTFFKISPLRVNYDRILISRWTVLLMLRILIMDNLFMTLKEPCSENVTWKSKTLCLLQIMQPVSELT